MGQALVSLPSNLVAALELTQREPSRKLARLARRLGLKLVDTAGLARSRKLPAILGGLLLALTLFSPALRAQVATIPLNTGFNHQAGAPGQPNDNYWITIAAFPPLVPAAPTPSWVLEPPKGWAEAFPETAWIGPRAVTGTAPGTTPKNPSYALFRKCFCLIPKFRNASIRLRLRADDTVQVWLNSVETQLAAPQTGSANGEMIQVSTQNQLHFRAGRNCLFVLVEDQEPPFSGFDLDGTMGVSGLLSRPIAGTAECGCPPLPARCPSDPDEEKRVAEILKIAESRRLEKKATQ